MTELYQIKPSRVFTFGCSFTNYNWATWANILGFELDCEFYNFGRSGAGNYYISNLISQADSYFNFNKNDLVMVCWTNVSREDRWTDEQGWITGGNIYNFPKFDKNFIKRWANDTHFCLRDFALIKLIDNLLKNKTQYHFLSMCDITKRSDQYRSSVSSNIEYYNKISNLINLYDESLNKILPSFYDVLWDDKLSVKRQIDLETIHPYYCDFHPTILEHFEYLKKTFDYDFSKKTLNTVNNVHNQCINAIKNAYDYNKITKVTDLSELPKTVLYYLLKECRIRQSDEFPSSIIF